MNYLNKLTPTDKSLCELALHLIKDENIEWTYSVEILFTAANHTESELIEINKIEEWSDSINCPAFDNVEFAAKEMYKLYEEEAEKRLYEQMSMTSAEMYYARNN